MSGSMAIDRQSIADRGMIFAGYVRAVSGATVAYLVLLYMKTLFENVPDAVESQDLVAAISGDVLVFGILGGAYWIGAFAAALPLFAAAYAVARRLGIRSGLYYAACGALTGLALTPVFVIIGPQTSWQNENDFLQDCVSWGPILITSGLCGGLAFWHKTGHHEQ